MGGITKKEEANIVNTKISECKEDADTGTLFKILFLEGGGIVICGGSLDCGSILCMSLVDKYNTLSHTWSRVLGAYFSRGNKGACVVMTPSSPHLPSSSFFQPVLSGATVSNVKILTVSCYHHTPWGNGRKYFSA